jgi:hypothetical protein
MCMCLGNHSKRRSMDSRRRSRLLAKGGPYKRGYKCPAWIHQLWRPIKMAGEKIYVVTSDNRDSGNLSEGVGRRARDRYLSVQSNDLSIYVSIYLSIVRETTYTVSIYIYISISLCDAHTSLGMSNYDSNGLGGKANDRYFMPSTDSRDDLYDCGLIRVAWPSHTTKLGQRYE